MHRFCQYGTISLDDVKEAAQKTANLILANKGFVPEQGLNVLAMDFHLLVNHTPGQFTVTVTDASNCCYETCR